MSNKGYLKALYGCVDILFSNTVDEEQLESTEMYLRTLLKNAMPFMRGEKEACSVVEATVKNITELVEKVGNFESEVFVKNLCDIAEISKDEALIYVMPALTRGFSDEFSASKNILLANGFKKAVSIFCKGDSPITVSKQLGFINEVFRVKPLDFIGDEKVMEMVDRILEEKGEDYILNRGLVEETVYRIFNKVRLGKIVEYCQKKQSSKNSEILSELEEKYDLKNEELFVDDPFYAKKAERLKFVKGLQKYTLEALVLTRDFLESKGLTFYLTEGTLLGAIRHNGFIPWDDDIDIAMPRKDYEKLVELAKAGEIPPELHFDSLETNKKHWVLGAKMQLTKPCEYVQPKVAELSECFGPYVDIFPLDCWGSPAGIKYIRANRNVKLARRMLFMKTGYSTAIKKKPSRVLIRMFLPFVSNAWVERFAIKNMKRFYKKNPKYYVNLCSYYPYYKEVFPVGFFGEPKYIDFEGERMPVPCEYDYMLKTVYGRSYDTIPPVRVTNMRKHAFELRGDAKEDYADTQNS